MPPKNNRANYSLSTLFNASQRHGGGRRSGGALGGSHPMSSSSGGGGGGGGGGLASHGFRIQAPEATTSTTPHHGGGYHYSSSSTVHMTPATAGAHLGVSDTLLDVRKRLMQEIAEEDALAPHPAAPSPTAEEESSSGSTRGRRSQLAAHRQRALEIAFEGRAAVGSLDGGGGGTPARARRSKSGASPPEAEEEEELLVSSVEFSLVCPYSLLPMTCPVRSRDCHHVQCCDMDSWLVLFSKCRSLRDPTGPCPVCKRHVAASSLGVDLWVRSVMREVPAGTHLVILEPDGSVHSADAVRERRRELLTTEVVDATQGDFVNYLGEVEEEGPAPPPPPQGGTTASSSSFVEIIADDEESQPPPPKEIQQEQAEGAKRPREDTPPAPLAKVKAEPTPPVPPLPSSAEAPLQDDQVVVVHFVEPQRRGRVLPSQLRLWDLHCPTCRTALVKGEDGGGARSCPNCGLRESGSTQASASGGSNEELLLVRRFEEDPSVVLELLPDGTLLLHGVDAAAPYLYRAGFQRTPFPQRDFLAPSSATAGGDGASHMRNFFGAAGRAEASHAKSAAAALSRGVWSTSFPLTRFELDFLEACCQRIATGEGLDELDGRIVPSLFRIPRRRLAGPGGGAGHPFSQMPPSQQAQQQPHAPYQGWGGQRPPSAHSTTHTTTTSVGSLPSFFCGRAAGTGAS